MTPGEYVDTFCPWFPISSIGNWIAENRDAFNNSKFTWLQYKHKNNYQIVINIPSYVHDLSPKRGITDASMIIWCCKVVSTDVSVPLHSYRFNDLLSIFCFFAEWAETEYIPETLLNKEIAVNYITNYCNLW